MALAFFVTMTDHLKLLVLILGLRLRVPVIVTLLLLLINNDVVGNVVDVECAIGLLLLLSIFQVYNLSLALILWSGETSDLFLWFLIGGANGLLGLSRDWLRNVSTIVQGFGVVSAGSLLPLDC